jgi:hypothetical protein
MDNRRTGLASVKKVISISASPVSRVRFPTAGRRLKDWLVEKRAVGNQPLAQGTLSRAFQPRPPVWRSSFGAGDPDWATFPDRRSACGVALRRSQIQSGQTLRVEQTLALAYLFIVCSPGSPEWRVLSAPALKCGGEGLFLTACGKRGFE